MNEETDDDPEDFRFWLKICTALTFVFYTFCGILIFLLRRIIGDALNETLRKAPPRPTMTNVVPFSNPVAITNIVHLENENRLNITLSLSKSVRMFVLRNIPLRTFHDVMISSTDKFHQFVIDTASENVSITTPVVSISTNEIQAPSNFYRNSYDLVLVFSGDNNVLDGEFEEERVVFSFHMIHIRQYAEERRQTQRLFSYCKTNRDRLICLRKIFASVNGGTENIGTTRPECSVCLTEVVDVVFVPCRHSPMCQSCLSSFMDNAKCLHCPICRVSIAEIKLL